MEEETISKEEFESYVNVQNSGVTNMFNVTLVCKLSGLTKEKVSFIMKNYEELADNFN